MVREITITWPRRRAYSNVLQFKITLLETDPPVWRRIQVPDYYTFYDLHVAIQDAMGWLGRWSPDRFDPAKVKFWSPLRRLKIALED
jgi:hypothetical protein